MKVNFFKRLVARVTKETPRLKATPTLVVANGSVPAVRSTPLNAALHSLNEEFVTLNSKLLELRSALETLRDALKQLEEANRRRAAQAPLITHRADLN